MRPEGPARGLCSLQGPSTPALGDKGSCRRSGRCVLRGACEGGCGLQGPGTPVRGHRGSCPRGGRCVLKGLRGGLQSSRPGDTSLGGQGILPRRWSVRPEGLARGAVVFKARGHQPGGTWGDRESCPGGGRCVLKGLQGGCNLQGPGTPAWGDRESCPGGGRHVLKGLRGGYVWQQAGEGRYAVPEVITPG